MKSMQNAQSHSSDEQKKWFLLVSSQSVLFVPLTSTVHDLNWTEHAPVYTTHNPKKKDDEKKNI